ncbi:hypothetical protein [Proteiniphilum sp. UBA5384]|uniref:hypothetical protein n=1 Tax=Proteiniphilum sp. UBA5384 TaxID=1947279 RepID=UPI0025D048A3|nr:hypothetical protein [Proteiniphilum sp. UBA5384]
MREVKMFDSLISVYLDRSKTTLSIIFNRESILLSMLKTDTGKTTHKSIMKVYFIVKDLSPDVMYPLYRNFMGKHN